MSEREIPEPGEWVLIFVSLPSFGSLFGAALHILLNTLYILHANAYNINTDFTFSAINPETGLVLGFDLGLLLAVGLAALALYDYLRKLFSKR